MNIKNYTYLFFTTLFVGAVTAFLTQMILTPTQDIKVIALFLLIGLMFSVLSQMGFFAYMMLNYIAKGMITKKGMWEIVQWILIVITFLDVIILRYSFFEENNAGILGYSILPIFMLIAALFIAWVKSKATNFHAFTPTVFFIFVVTIIEAVPSIRENNVNSTIVMIVPLLSCNFWQIMKLHKLVGNKQNNTQ
ncbi:KinB-signaling pathway activation protein [Chengkuizengella axinellae]|uniref:KinB-signaling pathway activation protein n=1 Tax=Chengkuizengella axinellae TaxID=3064388 RepID=A0ABT9J5N7_9BACL|nr:KinB-signaling pathway activation protein [Chengkuizengella sp. 2205SS18-9]MDP5276919.1 KinB-signaling pathway activation protein [Chengkuizengella sp. 2205SS18-9]